MDSDSRALLLPKDILLQVFSKLSARDRCSVSLACRQWFRCERITPHSMVTEISPSYLRLVLRRFPLIRSLRIRMTPLFLPNQDASQTEVRQPATTNGVSTGSATISSSSAYGSGSGTVAGDNARSATRPDSSAATAAATSTGTIPPTDSAAAVAVGPTRGDAGADANAAGNTPSHLANSSTGAGTTGSAGINARPINDYSAGAISRSHTSASATISLPASSPSSSAASSAPLQLLSMGAPLQLQYVAGTQLESIRVCNCDQGHVQAGFLDYFSKTLVQWVRNLRHLELHGSCNVDDAFIRTICHGLHLHSLTAYKCIRFTDAIFAHLAHCHTIQRLSVSTCPGVTCAGLLSLSASCPDLQEVSLEELKLSAAEETKDANRGDSPIMEGGGLLAGTTGRSLQQRSEAPRPSELRPWSDLVALDRPGSKPVGFLKLVSVSIQSCELDLDWCSSFGRQLPALQSLSLISCLHSPDPLLSAVSRVASGLERLCLAECEELTDVGVRDVVSSCPNLRDLSLSGCPGTVTTGSIEAIARAARGLQSLQVHWCQGLEDFSFVNDILGHPKPLNRGETSTEAASGASTFPDGIPTGTAQYSAGRLGDEIAASSNNSATSADGSQAEALASAVQPPALNCHLAPAAAVQVPPGDLVTSVEGPVVNGSTAALTSDHRVLFERDNSMGEGCPGSGGEEGEGQFTSAELRLRGGGWGRLQSLDLEGLDHLPDTFLTLVARTCPDLTSLSIHCCREVTAAGLITVARGCSHLTSLCLGSFRGSQLPTTSLHTLLSSCPSLSSLHLKACAGLTTAGTLTAMRGCPSLTSLTATSCPGISTSAVQAELARILQSTDAGQLPRGGVVQHQQQVQQQERKRAKQGKRR